MSESTTGLSRIPFTTADEQKLKKLATWLNLSGLFALFFAIYTLVIFGYTAANRQFHWPILLQAIIGGLVASWSLRGAGAFRKVVTSDVADQSYLVTGLSSLRSLFLLQALLMLVGILTPLVVLLATLVLGILSGRPAGA